MNTTFDRVLDCQRRNRMHPARPYSRAGDHSNSGGNRELRDQSRMRNLVSASAPQRPLQPRGSTMRGELT
jgi:hypothetical protein